ncbi:MAG: hypothetical protein ACT4QC_04790 [Planctomycetaceae bacterium]
MKTDKVNIDHLCELSRVMLDVNPGLRRAFQEAARSLAMEYRRIRDTVQNAPAETAASLESGPMRLTVAILQVLLGVPSPEHAAKWAMRETETTKV